MMKMKIDELKMRDEKVENVAFFKVIFCIWPKMVPTILALQIDSRSQLTKSIADVDSAMDFVATTWTLQLATLSPFRDNPTLLLLTLLISLRGRSRSNPFGDRKSDPE